MPVVHETVLKKGKHKNRFKKELSAHKKNSDKGRIIKLKKQKQNYYRRLDILKITAK